MDCQTTEGFLFRSRDGNQFLKGAYRRRSETATTDRQTVERSQTNGRVQTVDNHQGPTDKQSETAADRQTDITLWLNKRAENT